MPVGLSFWTAGKHADPECSKPGRPERPNIHRCAGLSDDRGTEYSPDRHAPANDPDIDTAAVELSDDEHDEQHQEEALCDLAEGVDEEQRSQPALGEDRAYSGAYAAGDDVTGVFVGGDRSGVGSHERGRGRDGEERGRVDDDDGADTAEADSESSERGADEPSQTRTGRVGSVGNRQLIRRHDSWEQGDGRRVVDLCEDRLGADNEIRGPDPCAGDREQRCERDRLCHVGGDQGSAKVPTIDEAPSDRTEQECSDQLDDEQDRGVGARTTLDEHVDRECHQQQPVADVVDEPTGPNETEVAGTPRRLAAAVALPVYVFIKSGSAPTPRYCSSWSESLHSWREFQSITQNLAERLSPPTWHKRSPSYLLFASPGATDLAASNSLSASERSCTQINNPASVGLAPHES